MNFDFSADEKAIKAQARRFLSERCPTARVHRFIASDEYIYGELWASIVELGWPGAAIPERYGGLELGYAALCALAEECGRALAPTPFPSSLYLAGEALMLAGTEAQKQTWLPRLASGESVGAVYLPAMTSAAPGVLPRYRRGAVEGDISALADGMVADFIIVPALDAHSQVGMFIVRPDDAAVERAPVPIIDLSRPHARIRLRGARAERLEAVSGDGTVAVNEALLSSAAVLTAFEQLGGADRCLEMARDYSTTRFAFNRPIGSFQAIKHKLADIYVKNELARSNAYYGAMALQSGAPDLGLAAACARVSATEAYEFASSENIQVHGGIGYTWEGDCHLYLRRSRFLAVNLGALHVWQERLFAQLVSDTGAVSASGSRYGS
jgi:alkylation response protein AidB-like acyl-CoA dehydrogenase